MFRDEPLPVVTFWSKAELGNYRATPIIITSLLDNWLRFAGQVGAPLLRAGRRLSDARVLQDGAVDRGGVGTELEAVRVARRGFEERETCRPRKGTAASTVHHY